MDHHRQGGVCWLQGLASIQQGPPLQYVGDGAGGGGGEHPEPGQPGAMQARQVSQ